MTRTLKASALRYAAAGVLNTAIGLAIILGLEFGLGVQANLANAIGYAVGVCVSFALSRLFVFGKARPLREAGPRYLVAVAYAFLLNQAVLTLARRVVPDGEVYATLAQMAGVGSYTATLFLLSHYWVFAADGVRRRRPWIDALMALVAFAACALVLMAPALPGGLTAGDSHIYNSVWIPEFIKATARGELAPRWLPGANLGLGASSFYYYPPLAFYVANMVDGVSGSGLSADQLNAWTSLVMLMLSGLAMYAWLRSQVGAGLAMAGGLLYMAAPYHLINIYVRSAFAEASAYMALPLVLLGLTRAVAGWRGVALLGVGYALLVCGHIGSALLATLTVIPFYALYLAWSAPAADRVQVLGRLLAGGVLGLALAAFYLAPALLMQDAARVSSMWTSLKPEAWTLFNVAAWPARPLADTLAMLAWTALGGSVIAALAAWRGGRFAAVAALGLSVLIAFGLYASKTPWTAPGVSSLLNTVQFPWRILLIMDFAAISALAIAAAGEGRGRLWLVLLLPLAFLPLKVMSIQKPIFAYVVVPDIEIPWAKRQIAIHRAPDEHLPPAFPVAGDPATDAIIRIAAETPTLRVLDPAARLASVRELKGGGIVATVETAAPTTLVARRLYFTAWRGRTADGHLLPTHPQGADQLLAVDVPAGRSEVRLRIERTPIEIAGFAVSLLALLSAGGLLAITRRRQ